MKKRVAIVLSLILALSAVLFLTACKKNADNPLVPDAEPTPPSSISDPAEVEKYYDRAVVDGVDTVYFGSVFQTAETEALSVVLRNLVNDGILKADADGTYVYDGVVYAMLTIDENVAGRSLSDGRVMATGEQYFFRKEAVAWRVISEDEDTLTLLASNVVDNCAFRATGTFNSASGLLNDGKTYANEYAVSYIREYVNGEFLDKIFTDKEAQLLLANDVDMSKSGSEYDGATDKPTLCDKAYLLSHSELKELDALIPSIGYTYAVEVSDYAVALGASAKKIGGATQNYIAWWLRSEGNKKSFGTCVPYTGRIGGDDVYRTVIMDEGVRPVIRISKQKDANTK